MPVTRWKLSLLLLGALFATGLAQTPNDAPHQGSQNQSLTTREHLNREAWWPSKQLVDHSQVAGTQACASCHGGIVRTQSTAQMALTMMPAGNSAVLAAHTGNIFNYGDYRYAVEKTANSFSLKITGGGQESTVPLQWAFGSGTPAQGYLWWQNGQLFESRFNYFADLHGFDKTPGRLQAPPISMDMAQGRKMAEFEARKCFSCHSTTLTTAEPLSAAQFHPGVTCEACHGPGRNHIATVKAANSQELRIVNPAKMTPMKAVDFCGACHGTPRDVELAGTAGKITVRFPAYRLEKSRCWGVAGDARLTCFACHNPHQPLEHESAAYDAACLRCHGSGGAASEQAAAKQPACPVAKSRCTSCHMPKFDVGGMHYEFTDHNIRIVKANAPFPD
jgi:hypothetical protein